MVHTCTLTPSLDFTQRDVGLLRVSFPSSSALRLLTLRSVSAALFSSVPLLGTSAKCTSGRVVASPTINAMRDPFAERLPSVCWRLPLV